LLVVEDDIRCSRYVDICFSWRGGSRPAHFKITTEAPERIGPDKTVPQIWRDGGKKGIFLQRNEAFSCPGSFTATGTTF
jgi:hypothetical protein